MFYLSEEVPSNKSIVMAVKTKGGKIVRKAKVLPIEISMAIAHRNHRGPNMSRKNSGTQLYPFPSFDKCDSLLFFPSTFSSCLNSADMVGLEKLLKHRTDKRCDFTIGERSMDVDTCVLAFELATEMHPDSVICVHQTKVVGNQIRALMYFKYTENRMIRKSLENTTSDPSLLEVCPTPRSNTPLLNAYLSTKSEEEQFQLSALVCSTEELVVYGTSTLVLTFDDMTKKITRFEGNCVYTSFGAV